MIRMAHQQLVSSLHSAYLNNEPLDRSHLPDNLSLDEAYRIQHAFTAAKIDHSEHLAGYKISMTSPETQGWFGACEPIYGQLTSGQLAKGSVSYRHLNEPLIELELVFVTSERLDGDSTLEEILCATQAAPGLEIPCSRFSDWFPKITKEQICADGTVGGKLVVGEARDYTYDGLLSMRGRLLKDGDPLDEGPAIEVMGHPVNALQWLLGKLSQHGLALQPGMFVSTGTFILPKPLEKATYTGDFDGLGAVTIAVVD